MDPQGKYTLFRYVSKVNWEMCGWLKTKLMPLIIQDYCILVCFACNSTLFSLIGREELIKNYGYIYKYILCEYYIINIYIYIHTSVQLIKIH